MAMLYNKLLLNDEDDEMKMCGNLRWTDDDDPNSVRVREDLDLVRIHTNSACFIFEYYYVQVSSCPNNNSTSIYSYSV